jgi:flagellar motor switch protein FliG
MAEARQVPAGARNSVFREFAETAMAQDFLIEGGVGFAREVLENAVGFERAEEIIGRLSAILEMRPFEFLRRTPPEQIYAALQNEAPQTVALTIANLHTTLAAQVLAQLPSDEQAEVALRIATMAETNPEVIKDVETVMRRKLSNVISKDYSATGGARPLAAILNHADLSTERNVLDSISALDAELAEEIRLLLFTFEDIVRLDDRSIQLVLKEINQKDLTLALRGASEDVKQKILSNMSSPRLGDAVGGDGVHGPPTPLARRGGAEQHRRRDPAARGAGTARDRPRRGRGRCRHLRATGSAPARAAFAFEQLTPSAAPPVAPGGQRDTRGWRGDRGPRRGRGRRDPPAGRGSRPRRGIPCRHGRGARAARPRGHRAGQGGRRGRLPPPRGGGGGRA